MQLKLKFSLYDQTKTEKVNEKLANHHHHHHDQIQLAKKQMWLDSFRIS